MSSGFITESEVVEIRQKRQEEWERVRNAEDPLERPEEAYDNRSLFDKLQEQKQKKDLEYEEAHKLKNMIKGLDDDEIEFLDLVDRTKMAADRRKNMEEEKELNDYRNRVATLQEKTQDKKVQAEVAVSKPRSLNTNAQSQLKLLKGAVVKKAEPVKRKASSDEGDSKVAAKKAAVGMSCIGILPGMGCYDDSSSDENSSSDSEEEVVVNKVMPRLDLCGRVIGNKEV